MMNSNIVILFTVLQILVLGQGASAQVQSNTSNVIFITYEKPAHFPCPSMDISEQCDYNKLALDFIRTHIRWPKTNACVEGVVFVRFDVELDGKLTNVEVVKKLHPLFDEEALRIVGLMPNWIPGTFNDRPVRSQYNLPIKFRLD